jgi:hypothetical protein
MAESAIAGLFQTPEMYQQARQQAQQQQQQQLAAQYAQMAPMQRAAYGSFMTGQQLGAGLGQLLGAEDPQLRMITQQQQILRQVDPNNPDSLAKGAQMAAQMGNNNLASMLATRAREAAANLALIQQRTEEKKTPEQRNAEAISNLQQQIASISALSEDTPGRAAALQSFTGQLTTLQGLTAKAPPAQSEKIRLAKELATLTGFPEGSPEYNTEYAKALNRLALGEDKSARFGVEREAIAMELYGKPVAQLSQTEIAAVNKRAEQSAAGKAPKIEVNIPGVKEVKDVPGLRSAIIATVKPFREIVNTTDQALQAVDDSIKEGNYISFNAARSQLAKALSGSDVSYKEIKGAGGDPSILGGLLDTTSTMFTGTPTLDTQAKIKKTLQAMRSVALKKGNAEIEAQRKLAERSGFKSEDFAVASDIPEFRAPVVGGGKTRTLSSGKVVTVID